MNPASKVSPKKKITLNGGRTNQYGENRHIAGSGAGNKPAGPDKSRNHP